MDNKEIVFLADKTLYSKDAVFKCLYWYGDKYYTDISTQEGNYRISLIPKGDVILNQEEKEDLLHKLGNDLVDFNLRDIVSKETQNIRDLLVAKAFSNGEFDETPPAEISDPVGFSI